MKNDSKNSKMAKLLAGILAGIMIFSALATVIIILAQA